MVLLQHIAVEIFIKMKNLSNISKMQFKETTVESRGVQNFKTFLRLNKAKFKPEFKMICHDSIYC